MRLLMLVLAIATGSCATAAEREDQGRKDLKGVWKGRVDEGATGHVLRISDAAIKGTLNGKQDLGTGTFKLDSSAKPWHMDATGTKGPQKGRAYLGIYSLEDDTLKWCVSMPGGERPTEFATKSGQFLLILKRQK